MRNRKANSPSRRNQQLADAVIEFLENRQLLSSVSPTILAAIPSNETGVTTSAGLQLSITPTSGSFVPDCTLLDPTPQIDINGNLIPASTPGPTGLTPTQLRHAYAIDSINFGAIKGDGTGQTIAIVDAYDDPNLVDSTSADFSTSDLAVFDQYFHIPDPPTFTKVNEQGTASPLPGQDTNDPISNDWETEETLDVEWAHAIAPGANILLVEANSSSFSDLITDAVGYARTVPGVTTVNMSFSSRFEDPSETGYDSTLTTPAGHSGITFCASTGDRGKPSGYPDYSPNVVAVGGNHVECG